MTLIYRNQRIDIRQDRSRKALIWIVFIDREYVGDVHAKRWQSTR